LLPRSTRFSLQLHFGCRSSSHFFVSFVVLRHVTYVCTLHSFDHSLPRTARSSLPKTITYIRSFYEFLTFVRSSLIKHKIPMN